MTGGEVGTDRPGPSGHSTSAFRVLLVCRANVCRSRAAEALLGATDAGSSGRLVVRSAGVEARHGDVRCSAMERLLVDREVVLPPDRGVVRLEQELLTASDLVLVAESSHRAFVARLSPSSRPRTFTLLEAAMLASTLRPAGPPGSDGCGDHDAGCPGPVDRVAEMNAARGTVPRPRNGSKHWGLRRPRPYPAIDVPDVHARTLREHRRTVELLERCLTTVVTSLACWPGRG